MFKLVKFNFPRIEFAPDSDKTEADNLAALKAYIQAKEASLFNTLPREQIQDEVCSRAASSWTTSLST
ncbi:MAG: hypothetical protein JJD98_16850 [Polaromonas sp.]|nr:hypothetical protein [Polaromonas sp.]